MTNKNDFNPSAGDILSAVVSNYSGSKSEDMFGRILGFDIRQSMTQMGYSGSITVLDTIGFIDDFPLRSEETMELKIKSFDTNTEFNIKVHVYKIDNFVVSESGNGLLYTIHFVSDISFKASTRRITKAYQSSISGIAKEVFETYFSKLGGADYLSDGGRVNEYATAKYPIVGQTNRSLFVQPTCNINKCIIPNMTPTDAMRYLQTQAYQPETPSNSFKFFETLDNFYFATDEYFIKTAQAKDLIDLFYAPSSNADGRDPSDQINRIEELNVISKGIDTANDMFSGSYKNRVTEIDFLRRKVVHNIFDYSKDAKYIDMSGNPRNLEDNPHTEAFRNDMFTDENAKDFLVYRDFQQPGDIPGSLHTDRHISQIVSNRISYQEHLNATKVQCQLKGRLDIAPGNIVNLEVQNMDGINLLSKHRTLSGRYLVVTVVHSRSKESNTLNTALELSKFDWSIGEIDA